MNGRGNNRRRYDGQCKRKCAAFAGLAFQPYTATMVFNNFFTNGKTKTCTFWFIGQGIPPYLFELFKNQWLIVFGNANAGVLYAGNDLVALLGHLAGNRTLLRKFYRV